MARECRRGHGENKRRFADWQRMDKRDTRDTKDHGRSRVGSPQRVSTCKRAHTSLHAHAADLWRAPTNTHVTLRQTSAEPARRHWRVPMSEIEVRSTVAWRLVHAIRSDSGPTRACACVAEGAVETRGWRPTTVRGERGAREKQKERGGRNTRRASGGAGVHPEGVGKRRRRTWAMEDARRKEKKREERRGGYTQQRRNRNATPEEEGESKEAMRSGHCEAPQLYLRREKIEAQGVCAIHVLEDTFPP